MSWTRANIFWMACVIAIFTFNFVLVSMGYTSWGNKPVAA